MKAFLVTAAAVLTLAGMPADASAKVRGCAYRLGGLRDAKIALDQVHRAGKTGDELNHARAQLQRAEDRAREEGCFARPVVIVPDRSRSHWNSHRDRFDRAHDRRDVRDHRALQRRVNELEYVGRRRGLTRAEYNELQALRRRLR